MYIATALILVFNMKMKSNLIHIILLTVILSLSSCGWLIFDQYEDDPINNNNSDAASLVYLNIYRAHQSGVESINDDGDDFEDRVHDLAMLVFDSNSGDLVSSYFDENIPFTEKNTTFTVRMVAGLRDFYFVANVPMAELKSITTSAGMELYMNSLRNLNEDLYLQATEPKGFPMARVYKNQEIELGGSQFDPARFKPINDLSVEEDKVKLIRTVAKLEVKLVGDAANMAVESISYRNAYRQYSMNTLPAQGSPVFYADAPMKQHTGNIYTYYMPEVILSSPSWLGVGNNRPINYFVIKTTQGIEHEIPIISHDAPISSTNYLKFAKGELLDKPDYSIFRNRRYYYEIEKLQAIEVLYEVEGWNEIKTYTYMGYGYNVLVDDEGNVVISNTIDACAPHSVKLQTVAPFTFTGGASEIIFDDLDVTAVEEYSITPEPETGDGIYLRVIYNGETVKEFSK